MIRIILYTFLLFSFLPSLLSAQKTESDKIKKKSLLDVLTTQKLPKLSLETDVKKLFADRRMMNYQQASASITFDDGDVWTHQIKIFQKRFKSSRTQ